MPFLQSKKEVVSVKDITGPEVCRKNSGMISAGKVTPLKINMMNLNSGLYFIELNAGEKRAAGKVTVKH